MNFLLKKKTELSGKKATIYTVELTDGTDLFEQFLSENRGDYDDDLSDILQRIRSMATKTGAQVHFFKTKEGKPGDGVCALYDNPGKNLRLYCIRMGNAVVILGGGGPKKTQKLQQDPKLKEENYLLRKVSELITEKMVSKEICFSDDEMELKGEIIDHD